MMLRRKKKKKIYPKQKLNGFVTVGLYFPFWFSLYHVPQHGLLVPEFLF